MSKSLFFFSLCLLLLSHALPVSADQYDDCITSCNQTLAPCVDQARLTAGNVQEEQDSIAACEKNKAGCIQACKDAETTPSSPPPPQQQPPQQQPGADLNKGIKTYEFK
jgi:hypothetical protein